MTDEAFWQLIEKAAEQAGDRHEQTEWLTEELTRLPPAQIVDFHLRLSAVRRRADTWPMWTAARVILDGHCSDDAFWYFQLWLLGLGRATFDRVVADPDLLAEVEQVRALAARPIKSWSEQDWPDWESLDYAAHEAYEDATGKPAGLARALADAGIDLPIAPNPPKLDPSARGRVPHLTLLFETAHRLTASRA